MANYLPPDKKALVLSLLSEGNSIRSTERMTGVHRDTIMRLMVEAGKLCAAFMDSELRNIKSKRIQADEIWSYVRKHQKRLTEEERASDYVGDQYCFVAMDIDTKLVPCFKLGKRDGVRAYFFMQDLASRIITGFQLSTDSFGPYEEAVRSAFGDKIDYAQINKDYAQTVEGQRRYSPPQMIRVTKTRISGDPKDEFISTSHMERQNLTMRMQMRRLTRLTNAYSKKWENLEAALRLYFWHYNFARVHESLKVTPAMQAGITGQILTWYDLLNWQEEKRAA
jgi:IS1 family transposase